MTLPSGYSERRVADVPSPTAVAFLPSGDSLVSSKDGDVFVIERGRLRRQPVLDLGGRICTERERGIGGIAVDPAFERNRFVYVYWTRRRASACPVEKTSGGLRPDHPVNRVSRFRLGSSLQAQMDSERVLIDGIPQLFGTHNGGDLQFARDGYLYVSVGDGGCDYAGGGCSTNNDAARDRHVLLGKILRIRRDGSAPDANGGGSTCARTGLTGKGQRCRETFASGLRNPFRMAFDPSASGTRFFINDVGQDHWEEIDRGERGADYGWNVREGPCPRARARDCGTAPSRFTDPLFSYRHGGCTAITGGAFVPGGAWSDGFAGSYLYADYTCGRIWRLAREGEGFVNHSFATDMGPGGAIHLAFGPGRGRARPLFYTTFAGGGQVRRIDYEPGNRAPVAVARARPPAGRLPLAVTFDARGSFDPDADPALRYRWDFGDGTQPVVSREPVVRHPYTAKDTFWAQLTVIDALGRRSEPLVLRIDAGNEPPRASISAPPADLLYEFGQPLELRGLAVDPEDGRLAPSRLSWTVVLHHKSHVHPFAAPTAGQSLSLTAPFPENRLAAATSYLELRLTATDSRGLAATTTRDLRPRLSIGLGGLRVRPEGVRDDGSLPSLRPRDQPGDGLDLRLSAPARVTITLERAKRRPGCEGSTQECLERFVPQPGQATLNAPAGASTIAFSGRVTPQDSPRPGLYRARLVAVDRWGRSSPARSTRYRLLGP